MFNPFVIRGREVVAVVSLSEYMEQVSQNLVAAKAEIVLRSDRTIKFKSTKHGYFVRTGIYPLDFGEITVKKYPGHLDVKYTLRYVDFVIEFGAIILLASVFLFIQREHMPILSVSIFFFFCSIVFCAFSIYQSHEHFWKCIKYPMPVIEGND